MPYLDFDTDQYSQLAEQIVYSEGAQLDPNADDIEGEALLPRYILELTRDKSKINLIWKTKATKVPEGITFELQVGIREDGPWYGPITAHENNGFSWRALQENTFLALSNNSYRHFDVPSDITLYYRVRPVAKDGSKGDYSNIVVTTSVSDAIDSEDITSPDPKAPTLEAYGSNGNIILRWNRQDNLLSYSHVEIQVADSPDGPWYAPDTVGGDTTWRSFNSGEHTEAAGFEFIHPSVPNILLYYRIRFVTTKEEPFTGRPLKSEYSNIASARSEVEVLPPTLTAVGSIGDVILNWDKQENLLHEKYIEIQVAENENGPWYAPYTFGDGGAWREDVLNGVYRVSGTTTFTHTNIPIAGTQDDPQLRVLWYRVRRVDSGDNESVWSNIVMASAGEVNLKFIPGVVQEAQLDATVFDALRTLSDRSIGYWSLDDTIEGQSPRDLGVLKDTSRNDNDLKVVATTVGGSHGVVGRALSFSGVSSSVAYTDRGLGSTGSWQLFTQSYWIKPLATQVNDDIVAVCYADTSPRIEFYVRFNKTTNLQTIILRSGGTEYSLETPSGTNVFDDRWHYVVLSYNGASKEVTLWIDGVKKVEEQITDSGGNVSTLDGIQQGGELYVGGASIAGTVGSNLNGSVDEVRLYNVVFNLAHVRYFLFIPEGPVAEIVDTERLAELSITETKIADDSISTPKLQANSVTANEIAALAILTKHLSANAVTANTIAAGAVLATHILASQILGTHIRANEVDTVHLKSDAVTADKIKSKEITTDLLTAEALRVLTTLADGSVTEVKIADGAVTADKVAARAIDASEKISSDIIEARHLDANSIDLEGKAIVGVLQANHIDSDVINAALLRTARVSLGNLDPNTASGSSITIASNVGSEYNAFLVGFSMGQFNASVIATRGFRYYIMPWDSARATEVYMGLNGTNLNCQNYREHEEAFSPDIGTVYVEFVIGLKWPNAAGIASGPPLNPSIGTPSGLGSTETEDGGRFNAALRWNAVPNADSYIVQYAIGSGSTIYLNVPSGTTTNIKVPVNTDYTFSVRAVIGGFGGNYSTPYSSTTGVLVNKPSGLGSTETKRTTDWQVGLTWTGHADATGGYRIQYKIGSGGTITRTVSSGTTRLNIIVPVSTSYSFRVQSIGADDNSEYSDWYNDSVGTIDATKLGTPGSLASTETAQTASFRVRLSWGAVTNAEGYELEYTIGTTKRTASGNIGTNYQIYVPANTAYSFRVKATTTADGFEDGDFSSTYSDSVGSLTATTTKLTTPSSLSTQETAGSTNWSVRLSWRDVANDSGYRLSYRVGTSGSDTVITLSRNTTSRTITVAPNTSYRFRVQAIGTGDYSDSDYSGYRNDSVGSIVTAPSIPGYQASIIPINPSTGTSPMRARVRRLIINNAATTVHVEWRRSTSPSTWTSWSRISAASIASYQGSTGRTWTLPDSHVGGRSYEIAVRIGNSTGFSSWRVVQFNQRVGGANFTFVWRTGK